MNHFDVQKVRHDRLVLQTFWCELVVVMLAISFDFFDPLNGQTGFGVFMKDVENFILDI